ncbi:unnamed protein product [Cyprideis torosa]|uniref:Uncharacterized protein n=1 Tax=Cyprideis torosa TaxID=163714 RepID=A0A7R8ZPE8_9CRUS|nr:unnamed protein product [Cyprideis torosa]CAG0893767.1 unnamed protein product [Cyprideis torosa]
MASKSKASKGVAKTAALNATSAKECGALRMHSNGKSIILHLHCKPGAAQSRITAVAEDAINVAIGAPPTGGEANTELIRFLSKVLGVRKTDLQLTSGHKGRDKSVQIQVSEGSSQIETFQALLQKQVTLELTTGHSH